jgi:hypothetical protein
LFVDNVVALVLSFSPPNEVVCIPGASAAITPGWWLLESDEANLVKRSEMLFRWDRFGRMMWTSGSGQCGSWRPSTATSWRILIGISWVMYVCRSRVPLSPIVSLGVWSGRSGSPSASSVVVKAMFPSVHSEERTVSAKIGVLSFFVRRSWEVDAPHAERKARLSTLTLISRLIASELDSSSYVESSNIVPWTINVCIQLARKISYNWDCCPHLRALVGDDGEADHLIFQAHPAYLAQRGQGSGEF